MNQQLAENTLLETFAQEFVKEVRILICENLAWGTLSQTDTNDVLSLPNHIYWWENVATE